MMSGGKLGRPTRVSWLVGSAVLAAGGCRPAAPADLVITDVTVIDGTERPPRPGMSVAIRKERIVAVGRAERVSVPPGAARIDGRGKFLIPGLWDMHVHLMIYAERSLPLFLANGVTTIREVGDDLQLSGWLRQEVQAGRLLGPRVLIAGPILDGGLLVRAVQGTRFGSGRVAVPDPEAARRVVDSLQRLGVDLIKVHSATPRAAYFAILERARHHRLPVVGHIPDSVLPREAIDSGQRTIEHDWRLAIANSARGPELSSRMLGAMQQYIESSGPRFRFLPYFEIRLAVEDTAGASYDSATAKEFARLAASRPVWFDPTLIALETQARKNEPEMRELPELKYAPAEAREFEDGLPVKPHPTQADIDAGPERWRRVKAKFAELIRGGGKFVAGTDVPIMPLVPSFSLQRELSLLVEAGLTPLQAIQAASRNAAEAMRLQKTAGTVEPGKAADLVLLDADPLKDITNTRRIAAVIVRGHLLERRTLDRMLVDAEAYAKQ